MSPIRFDWTHFLPLNQGTRAWERLGLALGGAQNASDVSFVLRDAQRHRTLGQATVNLRQLLDDNAEMTAQNLKIKDATGMAVAECMVTVRALDALVEVERTELRGGGGSRGSSARSDHSARDSRGGAALLARWACCRTGAAPHLEGEVTIEVRELRLESKRGQVQPRTAMVRIEALGMEGGQPLETRALAPPGGSTPMRFQYSHTIRLTQGEPEWRALQDAVDAAKPPPPSAPTRGRIGSKEPQPAAGKMNMYFVVVDSSSNADLGEASYDLSPLLLPNAREASALQSIVAKDRTGASVGTLSIRVKAFDAIKLVQEAAPPGRDGRHGQDDRTVYDSRGGSREPRREEPQPPTFDGPPKLVAQLKAEDLRDVLTYRGVRLSSTLQARTFYLDQCRKHKITEVTELELHKARSGERPPPEAKIDLGVSEVAISERHLHLTNPRSVCVRVEAMGIEGAQPLETIAASPPASGGRKAEPLRLDWQHTISMAKGDEAWAALSRALDAAADKAAPAKLEIAFVAIDAHSGGILGQAAYDLAPLLRSDHERVVQTLQLFDQRHNVGTITVSVKALDAIRHVQREPDYGALGPHGAATRKQKVSVTVPSLHMPGEPIPVVFEGQTYDVTVPRGVRAGQSFEVELDVPARRRRRARPRTTAGATGGRWGCRGRSAPRDRRDDGAAMPTLPPRPRVGRAAGGEAMPRQPAPTRRTAGASTSRAQGEPAAARWPVR